MKNSTTTLTRVSRIRYYSSHVAPFLLLAVCIYLAPLLNIARGLSYPIQTFLLACGIIYCWQGFKQEIRFAVDWPALAAGVFVFLIWILFEGFYPQIGFSEFDPYRMANNKYVNLSIFIRLIGAALIIPVVEELFWRSFALRFLIKSDFKSVTLGQFTWFSFLVVSIAFGFEHHRWLPGIAAGMVYAGVLYRSKNLFSPIQAHATTNFLLGIYVIATKQWHFW
jgi:CAAX prenyl protease-like protein